MDAFERITSGREASWLTEGLSEAEIKTTVELAKISARIELCRLEMGLTQQEFAKYMGVSQGMVSKWESREYNFTIRSLNEIGRKLDLDLFINLSKPCKKTDFKIVKWTNAEKTKRAWFPSNLGEEDIA